MRCAICGKEIKHDSIPNYFGNNPYPIRTNEEDRCCDECNSKYVIPIRIITAQSQNMSEIAEKLNTCNQETLDVLLKITED